MPKAELTLHIDGDVILSDFARRLSHLDRMVRRMTTELNLPRSQWSVSDLDAGSATSTISAEVETVEIAEVIEESYLNVGRAVSLSQPSLVPFSESVLSEARAIAATSYGRVQEVEFIAADQAIRLLTEAERLQLPERVGAYGAVRGTAETASVHNRQFFTVYEATRGVPVKCYPREQSLDVLRSILGSAVLVSGWVRRDLETGRPIDVKGATVEPLEVVLPGAWREAIGILQVSPEGLSAEEAVRRFRDG